MLDVEEFGEFLSECGFRDFSGVPCSYLAPLINYAINENRFIMASNEGDAVAIASGISLVDSIDLSLGNHSNDFEKFGDSQTTSLASSPNFSKKLYCDSLQSNTANARILDSTNKDSKNHLDSSNQANQADFKKANYGVVLMQNSGLSNALSPLTSLNHTFEIPILGFVSLRGERDSNGINTDEPQHELLGVITHKLLAVCKIEYAFLSQNMSEAKHQILQARKILESKKSFFFIVRDKTFSKVMLKNNPLQDSKNHKFLPLKQLNLSKLQSFPSRLQALEIIQKIALDSKAVLLATTGKCGRELYEIGDEANQLYMVGSMGCVSSLALGIALKSDKKVIAIDGDSALLMRLGSLSTNAYYAKDKDNFCHILLDNQSHDSTGGQFNLSPFVDFCAVASSCGYSKVCCAQNLDELKKALQDFMESKNNGAHFIYIRIAKGSKENLGRPKITPKQVALRLNRFLKG